MKRILVYSKYNAALLSEIEKSKIILNNKIDFIEYDNLPELMKKLVREMPCLIVAEEHLQGSTLLQDDVNGVSLLEGEILKKIDFEEKAIQNLNHERLDSHIKYKQIVAEENMLMEMIIEGRI